MSELYTMVTVTDRGREKRFLKLYEENGCLVNFVTLGRGTATNQVLDSFGLEGSEKSIIHTVVTDGTFSKVKRALIRQFRIDVPGTGVVFLIPLSSMGGKKQLSFLTAGQDFIKGEEGTLKRTKYELIVIIAKQGYTDKIMDAAKAAGAGGGTVLHAKGTGMKESEKFFGFVIADEKEMIYTVVKTELRDRVMRAVMNDMGIKSKAQTVCFSLPVTDTAGMRLLELDEEDGENGEI